MTLVASGNLRPPILLKQTAHFSPIDAVITAINTGMAATEDHANRVIEILADLTLRDQIACLTSLIYAHVLGTCQRHAAMDHADDIVNGVIASMPKSWAMAKAYALHGTLPN